MLHKIFYVMTAVCLTLAVSTARSDAAKVGDVLETYANLAEAGYQDSVTSANKLQVAVDAFLQVPTSQNLDAARAAWISARVPYMQTEVFRFGNKIVDDWEGRVNAWPLDEGLIDYVDGGPDGAESAENTLFAANVIANRSLKIDGKNVDASAITKALLTETLHEAGGIEANVATGYHAIEFLLWGQDLNGTKEGAGARPATDFDQENCTNKNCDRRAAYLKTVTDLLVDDLNWMAKQWGPNGRARQTLLSDPSQGVKAIFTGLGSLTYGEMAGERIRLGLLLHDPEEEHDCFSDNTHNSHFYDIVGIRNVYLASYTRTDGTVVKGAAVSDLVREKSAAVDEKVRKALGVSVAKAQALKKRAESKERYDQMLAQGNKQGNAVIQSVVDSLVAQARELERAIAVLKLENVNFEGSDSLDEPAKVEGADKELLQQ